MIEQLVAGPLVASSGARNMKGLNEVLAGHVVSLQDTGPKATGQNGLGVRSSGVAYTVGTTGRQGVVAFDETQITHPENRSNPQPGVCHTLPAHGRPPSITPAVADPLTASEGKTYCHAGNNPRLHNVVGHVRPRQLMPVECERLQGLPDGHTAVTYRGKPAKDGPRYRAIGNSMAVPVMRWIGQRIQMVESP